MPRSDHSELQSTDQPANKAKAQTEATVLMRGIAVSHLVVLSTMVKRWVKPREGGRGLTRSTWMWENRLEGAAMAAGGRWMWRMTFPC
jgi:hypothetical protein